MLFADEVKFTWNRREITIPKLDLTAEGNHDRYEFFRRAFSYITYNEIAGDYVEFGCASGKTFRMAADQIIRRKLTLKQWAFDSFKGLPAGRSQGDYHPKWPQGAYSMSSSMFVAIMNAYKIPSDQYTVVEGFYQETIGPGAMRTDIQLPSSISFAYIDCDLYSSTLDVLHFLSSRLKVGMIIAFDDYYCYADGHISGERRALSEFSILHPEWNFEKYQTYGWAGQSFIVEQSGERNQRNSSLRATRSRSEGL